MSIEGVRAHFGFTRMPFQKDLAPSMLHHHQGHDEAVARVNWLVEENAIGVITGEVGAGKTVVLRAALGDRDASRHTIVYLGNPSVGVRGLYQALVARLGGTPRFHKAALVSQAQELLSAETTERGRRVVLAVDEAHLLDAVQLEELRMLTNAEMDSVSPFALLLCGQPVLRARLRLGSFAALDQRVGLRYALGGMAKEETADYVAHHLRIAGRSDTLFSDDAIARIHDASRGLPRAVNNLCVQALVATYAEGAAIIDDKAARVAIGEVTSD